MKYRLLGISLLATACDPDGGRVSFTTTQDGGAMDAAPSDAMFPNLGRDAVPVRETGPVVIPEDAACATSTSDGRRRPMNLLVILDRSGSMNERGRWGFAVSALRALLTRLDDETRVGITFFPSAANPDQPSGYTTPAVPVGPLGTTRAQILSRLSSTTPGGGTPMTCAIQGTLPYYRGFTMDGSRNVILITDGVPTEECTATNDMCGAPNLFDIVSVMRWAACRDRVGQDAVRVQVALAQRESPPVRVFVAGTPDASDTFLSDLAINGGSPRAPDCRASTSCHYSLRDGSFEADLTAALNEIRGRALSCEFEVDADPSRVDPTRVNVSFQGAGGASALVPRDVDHRDGWDWSPGMRSVVLHGPACERVRNDAMARVRIVFGCPSVTPG